MSLQARVKRLERENRRIKGLGLSVICVYLLATVTMGAAAAFDWVSAYGFTLRDERTRDRGGIAYDPKGGPIFCLKDEDGNVIVRITMEQVMRDQIIVDSATPIFTTTKV
ncbi:MAG: hypothetical protein AB7G28_14865 [Pirellulales bacterium]